MQANTMKSVAVDTRGVASLSGLGASIRRWLTYRETVGELRKLSPRQLADIGVEADVEDFAWRISAR